MTIPPLYIAPGKGVYLTTLFTGQMPTRAVITCASATGTTELASYADPGDQQSWATTLAYRNTAAEAQQLHLVVTSARDEPFTLVLRDALAGRYFFEFSPAGDYPVVSVAVLPLPDKL